MISKNPHEVAPKEDDHQMQLVAWANYHPILKDYLYAIPNGGSRHVLEAVKLKRMGVRSGVSDLHLPYPTTHYPGLWIELKLPKPWPSKISKLQSHWLQLMQGVGYATYVAYGFDHAREILVDYLQNNLQ